MISMPREFCPTRRFALALSIPLLVGCETPTAPPFPGDAPPTAFSVSVGGFGFGTHDVTLSGDTLVIVRAFGFGPDSVRSTRVLPGRADWSAFWRAADAAGVRSWPRECADPQVVDGGGYSIDIAYTRGRIQTSGVNSYARRNGGCTGDVTDEYRAFTNAVATLIGSAYP